MASQLCRAELWHKFGAKEHWAKIELPPQKAEQRSLRERLQVCLLTDAHQAVPFLVPVVVSGYFSGGLGLCGKGALLDAGWDPVDLYGVS